MARSRKASRATTKKRSSSSKRPKATSQTPFWRRLLTHSLLWKSLLVLIVLLAAYLVYLDATIRASFEGKKWALPARVYAQPLELFVGARLSIDDFTRELQRLGYREGVVDSPGMYSRAAKQMEVYSRGHVFWDGEEPGHHVRVGFEQGYISRLEVFNDREISILRLDPLPIGAIYPNHNEDRMLVALADVPPMLVEGLLAVEDHRFYEHRGVSLKAILRAAWSNFRERELVQGGSTITQQLVKNFYLSRERSYRRKLNEALMALLLELRYGKDEILETYLNEVYLGQSGSRAIHGFGLASYHYFNRPLHELSVDKLALLIALVKGPAYFDPWRHPQRALTRRGAVIDIMLRQGLLHKDDALWAQSQPLSLGRHSRSQYAYPAFIDLVRDQLRVSYSDEALSADGLKIYTSLNSRLQELAEKAVESGLSRLSDSSLQVAMVVTDVVTGEVQAIVGSNTPRFAGFNRALDALRPVGSLIKPVVYVAALDQSPRVYHLASILDDKPLQIETDAGELWSPNNFDRESHGDVPLFMAFAKSYNQATVGLGLSLGLERIAKYMRSLGVEPPSALLPSMTIGAVDMTPFEVAGMYQPIAAGGLRSPLRSIRSVLDLSNEPLERFPLAVEQTINEQSMYLLQYAMAVNMKHGTGRSVERWLPPDFSVAGKTGTSNDQRDAWFAGFSGDLLAVVWVGRDDNRPTNLTGSSAALPIWADFIANASSQPLRLSVPDGIVFEWVDRETGQRSRSACSTAVKLPFIRSSSRDGDLPIEIFKGPRACFDKSF